MTNLMTGLALGSPYVNRVARRVWTPARLFANGEQGVWLDPSDDATLFQETTGATTPAGEGDPVGLILDKSRGLVRGPELVTNGTFDSDLTGWTVTAGVTPSDGKLRMERVEDQQEAYQVLSGTQGKWVELTLDAEEVSGSAQLVYAVRNVSGAYLTGWLALASGSFRLLYFNATGDDIRVDFKLSYAAGVWLIDNVSVRELPGNHATAPTSAARPVRRRTPGGLWYLDFDGVDDFLALPDLFSTSTWTLVKAALFTQGYFIDWNNPRHTFASADILDEDVNDLSVFSLAGLNTAQEAVFTPSSNPGVLRYLGGETRSEGQAYYNTAFIVDAFSGVGDHETGGIQGSVTLGARFSRNERFATMQLFGIVATNRALTASETTAAEEYFSAKSGATLP